MENLRVSKKNKTGFKIAVRAGVLPPLQVHIGYKLFAFVIKIKPPTNKFKEVSKFDDDKFIWHVIMNHKND